MKKILIAYLFWLLDLELVVNAGYFSLLLPLVGAALLGRGFAEMADENEQFEQCSLLVFGVAVLRVGLFLMQSVAPLWAENAYIIMASLTVVLLFFALTHCMLSAFREIEEDNQLFAASRFCVVGEYVLCAIGFGCVWARVNPTLGVNFLVFSIVASLLFLFTLYQLKVIYLKFAQIL